MVSCKGRPSPTSAPLACSFLAPSLGLFGAAKPVPATASAAMVSIRIGVRKAFMVFPFCLVRVLISHLPGILNGITDNRFGVGVQLDRKDKRIHVSLGKGLTLSQHG